MNGSAVYRPYREAAATARLSPHASQDGWQGLRAHRFEFVSRGDFVPGLLYLPEDLPENLTAGAGDRPAPLVLLQHDARGSKQSDLLGEAAGWVRAGLAVALIDLPLHGERSSPKLSERLWEGVERISRGAAVDLETRVLLDEFARQSTSDLTRCLDALSALPEIDSKRIAFAGLGLGAVVGSYLLAHDARPRAGVLAFAGGGRGPRELDPATWLERSSDVNLLIVAAASDESDPGSGPRALFDRAPEPRRFASAAGPTEAAWTATQSEILAFLTSSLGA